MKEAIIGKAVNGVDAGKNVIIVPGQYGSSNNKIPYFSSTHMFVKDITDQAEIIETKLIKGVE